MQTGGLLKDLTVKETVQLTGSLFGDPRPVGEVLRRSGIDGIADRRVAKCSGGEQQRLRFALALLPQPDLLVLDEPTTGMDVEARRAFWARSGRTPRPVGPCCSPLTTSTRPMPRPTGS
jgi:ABC-2 type transport system ATP-binding protein